MRSRSGRANLAKTTLQVMDVGRYVNPQGESVSIAEAMEACNAGSEFYTPGELERLREEVVSDPALMTEPGLNWRMRRRSKERMRWH
ncbi:hypothetical protein Enr10x_26830 [Gimesia panareensis]|uniref:Microbial-type PARG catalytic domain-containing protein n=1 Tax=Gimesia panareensis TaxID=2527978 RepID=A0A517Q6Y4_9PLAN|nr:poly(ADP-ribose) glycohydrolase domain-containing protein [Gimesia panareensis]QDT27366.1 hypothetical protein Enr10x_26830 [Gimesia panareensis]